MNTAKLALATVAIAVLVVAVYTTSPSWLPRGTTLEITPSGDIVESGTKITFTTFLIYGKTEITSNAVTWSATDGSFDKTNGILVVFTAPTVSASESVTISAKFTGMGLYQPSSATAMVTVTPAPPAQPRASTLKISPNVFEVRPGDTLVLDASLTDASGNILSGRTITWSIIPSGMGSLSSTSGTSVTYTASAAQENTTVTIMASFAGDAEYLASNDSSQGTVFSQAGALKTATVLTMSPSSFSIQSNGTLVLDASLTDASGNILSGRTITWSIIPSGMGSLSSTSGTSVTYTASAAQENTTVTIMASFAGDAEYLASNDSSAGEITGLSALSDLYFVTFDSAALTNVRFQGPIIVDGMSVTNITFDSASVSEFTLSHIGLSSSAMNMSGVDLYVTYFKAYSPDSGNTIEITGDQNVNLGPAESANYENGTMYVVRMSATNMNLTRMRAIGETAESGSEPYVPSILSAQSATLAGIESITGPVMYGNADDLVSNVTAGTAYLLQFSLAHPVLYSLDRVSQQYNYTNRWLLAASSATGLNVSIYTIYFNLKAHGMYSVTATGDDDVAAMIPHSFFAGSSFSMSNLGAHAVYFSADELTLHNFELSIK